MPHDHGCGFYEDRKPIRFGTSEEWERLMGDMVRAIIIPTPRAHAQHELKKQQQQKQEKDKMDDPNSERLASRKNSPLMPEKMLIIATLGQAMHDDLAATWKAEQEAEQKRHPFWHSKFGRLLRAFLLIK